MKRVIVFLHEDTDEEKKRFCESNKGFIDCNEGDFRYRLEGDDAFAHVWCDNGHKNALRNVLDLSSASESLDEITPKIAIATAWAYIYPAIDKLFTVLGSKDVEKMLVFVHWRGTTGFEGMDHISRRFNTFLKGKYGDSWKSYAISSEMRTRFNKPIFDVNEPVIPVVDFDKWFEMYEEWWKGNCVLPQGYKFVDHKTLGCKKDEGGLKGRGQSGRSQEENADNQNNSEDEIKSMFEKTTECKTGASWIGIWLLVIATIIVAALCLSFSFGLLPLKKMPLLITDRLLLMFSINCLGIAIIMVFAALISSLHNRIRRKEILYGGELNVLMKNIARMPDSQAKYKAVNRVMEKVEKIIFGSMVRD